MIKVGITEAHSSLAGELIRILINHPEVELKTLYSPQFAGRSISSQHHGLIGEKIVNFTDEFDPSILDVLILIGENNQELLSSINFEQDNLKLILLSPPSDLHSISDNPIEIGLSEINRKALVRGASIARIPSPLAALSLIVLYPFGLYQELPENIEINIGAPEDIVENFNPTIVDREITRILSQEQKDFHSKIDFNISANKSSRVARVKISFKCSLTLEEVLKIYDSIYDDHNFVYLSMSEVEGKEIEGTQKTVIHIEKNSPDDIQLEIIGDIRLRGGAGDVTHVLNLFFALYEKIGLQLKPSRYGDSKESTSRPPAWFG